MKSKTSVNSTAPNIPTILSIFRRFSSNLKNITPLSKLQYHSFSKIIAYPRVSEGTFHLDLVLSYTYGRT